MLLLLMTLFSCVAPKGDINLTTNGSTKYVIVLPAEASKNETKAAAVLQNYLKRLSGASFNIVKESAYKNQPAIFVGNTEHALNPGKLKNEGFYIATDDQHVYLRGGSGKGVLYGVYTLLETYFGCRKYADIPATVPVNKDLHMGQQLMDKQEPAFIYRETYYPAAFDNEYLEWHKLHRFEDLWGLWGHSFFKLVPPKTYFAAHPEYYALVNGKRQATQLCLSNEAVFNITVDYFKKAIAANPDAIYWSVSAEDGPGFCTCEECSKPGSLIRFVNRVAAKFPKQQFTTLAYQYTAKPADVKPAANVYIMLSSIDAYRQEPLSTAPSAAEFRKNLEGWGALTDNIFIWDYTTQFTNYLAPFPDYNNLQPNLQYFLSKKVKGVFSQGSGDTYADMAAYNAYVQAKLLWDPASEKVDSEFLTGYYGKAGKFIGQYMQALSKRVRNVPLDIYGNPVNNHTNYLSAEAIDEYSSILDNAEKADTFLTRVSQARLPLEYTVLQQSLFFGTEKNGYMDANHVVNPRWPERVSQFVAQAKAAGVRELSEGGIIPEVYQLRWNKVFARKWMNSLAFNAPVKLENPYSEDYPAKGEKTLTDGLQGDNDFSINWLFMYGKDLVATIDLGKVQPVKSVQMNFLLDPRHYIFLPSEVLIEYSKDGVNYSGAGRQSFAVPGEDYSVRINNVEAQFSASEARYIKVTARCAKSIPNWRAASPGKLPALCCDEVFVQ
jgi:hypothetical protein